MTKQIMIKMGSHYPFGQSVNNNSDSDYKIFVKQTLLHQNQNNQQQFQSKISLLKNLSQTNLTLVSIKSILQGDDDTEIVYQYIPIKLQSYINNYPNSINCLYNKYLDFANFLADNHILHAFKIHNMGLTLQHQPHPKYFIGLNFSYTSNFNPSKIKSIYLTQLQNIFKISNQKHKQISNSTVSSQPKKNEHNQSKQQKQMKENSKTQIPSQSYIESLLRKIKQNKQRYRKNNGQDNDEKIHQKSLNQSSTQINQSKNINKTIVQKITQKKQSEKIENKKQNRLSMLTQKFNQLKNRVFGKNQNKQPMKKQFGKKDFFENGQFDPDCSQFAEVLSNIAPEIQDMDLQDGLLNQFMNVLQDPSNDAKIFEFGNKINEQNCKKNEIKVKINLNNNLQNDQIIWSAEDNIKSRVNKAIQNSHKMIGKIKNVK